MSKNLDKPRTDRRCFIGGSDARIIMGGDEAALIRLWKEKRGEAEPEDLSDNLVVRAAEARSLASPRRSFRRPADRGSRRDCAGADDRQQPRARADALPQSG